MSEWVIIHSPEGGFGLDSADNYEEIPSPDLPDGYIKGTVGAGDAFCSGTLYGAYRGLSLGESLELGAGAALCSLSEPGATEGMRSGRDAIELYKKYRGSIGA